ncbi:Acylpyruvase FAHD1 [Trichinella spiralis]|uniref:oxaloacetate tautomerase n=1 Tax=Trichinella spiralis TaxID=6334 RepID=A0ABR3KK12_TRISP
MTSDKIKQFYKYGRKIVAVVRNYREHAKEMGQGIPEKPIFFIKPSTAYVTEGLPICIPKWCQKMQHEVELGVVIGKTAKQITNANAMDFVAGYCLALDMTARDLQEHAKANGQPWFISKGFDTSCPVSKFIDKMQIENPSSIELLCSVNGQVKQRGNIKQMIFTIPQLLAAVTEDVTMEEGDLLLTGTPSGVSTVKRGDVIECTLGNEILRMKFEIA